MASAGAVHAARLLLRVAFDPNQPRDPAGTSTGGQWTSAGGAGPVPSSEEHIETIGIVANPTQNGPVSVGPIKAQVYRVGPTDEPEVYFGGTYQDTKPYSSLHEGHEVQAYKVETKNTIAARNHFQLYSYLHPGKTMQDAIYNADKASFKRTGGKGDSKAAWRKIQRQMMRDIARKGYDSVIFTHPPDPAKTELVIINKKSVGIRGAARGYYPLRDAADHLTPSFSVAIRAAFALGRKALPDVDAAIKAVARALAKTVPGLLARGLVEGGTLGAVRLKLIAVEEGIRIAAKKPLVMQFDAKAPRVKSWARKHAAELVKGIADVTRDRLRAIVAKHAGGGLDDAAYAKALTAAVGDADRAEVIARTESMRAVHEGQRQVWAQAVDKGLLPEGVKRTWIVTSDDRLCPVCEPLDGETADLDGLFADEFEGPPAHPNCRCTEGLA